MSGITSFLNGKPCKYSKIGFSYCPVQQRLWAVGWDNMKQLESVWSLKGSIWVENEYLVLYVVLLLMSEVTFFCWWVYFLGWIFRIVTLWEEENEKHQRKCKLFCFPSVSWGMYEICNESEGQIIRWQSSIVSYEGRQNPSSVWPKVVCGHCPPPLEVPADTRLGFSVAWCFCLYLPRCWV